MRVIGVDPGGAVTGFGLVDGTERGPVHLRAGTIRTAGLHDRPMRLRAIHERLLELIDLHAPAAMSLERNFVARNVQSAFRIGEARAVAMLAAAERGLALFEYTPNQVKLAVAAYGHADKAQVKFMVRRALNLCESDELADDAADALALALCHLGRAAIVRSWPGEENVKRAPGGLRR